MRERGAGEKKIDRERGRLCKGVRLGKKTERGAGKRIKKIRMFITRINAEKSVHDIDKTMLK